LTTDVIRTKDCCVMSAGERTHGCAVEV
jgi:hypothetical protein